jgi:hypothetical protein
VRISWLVQTWTPPAARTPLSWHSVGFSCCRRILSARSSCCGFRRPHESTSPKTTQASLGLGFLSGALSAGYSARWLAMPAIRKFQRSAGSSYEAARPTRRGGARKSHHPLRPMPSGNPSPCRDSHTVRLVTGQIVNSNGKRDHGQPLLSLSVTCIRASRIRLARAIRVPRYVGGCWAITLRTPQHGPTCGKAQSGYALIRPTWRKNEAPRARRPASVESEWPPEMVSAQPGIAHLRIRKPSAVTPAVAVFQNPPGSQH